RGIICKIFVLPSRTSPRSLVAAWRRLRQTIRSFRPDLLHAQYGTMTAFLSAFAAPVPLVVTYRASDLPGYSSAPSLRAYAGALLSQAAALRARHIICVSEQLRGRLWSRKQQASVIPTGVDTTIFYPCPRLDARARLGWKVEQRIVLFNAGQDPD